MAVLPNPDDYARARELYLRALQMPQERREAFVENAEVAEPLRREVRALLSQTDRPLIESEQTAPLGDGGRRDDPLGIVGQVMGERYRIDSFVAEGGFSFVYRGRHLGFDHDIAVKVFKPMHAGPDAERLKASFLREGALVSDLSTRTTRIVRSYDVGTYRTDSDQELLFIVLQWLQGETLAQLLWRERREQGAWGWSLRRVIEVLEPIADALRIAHAHGVAHRDIKPSNIHLGPEGTKLLDFGVAKDAGRSGEGFAETSQQASAFSVAYAAPEQLDKSLAPTGPWTDVYGLAIVCVELLAGKHPFDGAELLEIMSSWPASTSSSRRGA